MDTTETAPAVAADDRPADETPEQAQRREGYREARAWPTAMIRSVDLAESITEMDSPGHGCDWSLTSYDIAHAVPGDTPALQAAYVLAWLHRHADGIRTVGAAMGGAQRVTRTTTEWTVSVSMMVLDGTDHLVTLNAHVHVRQDHPLRGAVEAAAVEVIDLLPEPEPAEVV